MRSVEPRLKSRSPAETPRGPVRNRPSHRSTHSSRALFLLSWVTAFALLGCKDTTCRGVVTANGCEEPCRNDACGDGERCVENRCAARCDVDEDCPDETCERRTADDGSTAKFCTGSNEQPSQSEDDDVVPFDDDESSAECTENSHCNESGGQRCIDGVCRLTCELHSHCGSAGACAEPAEDVEGEAVLLCAFDDFPRAPGQYGTLCPNGNGDCAADFRCIGAGEGDASAYCTATGCDADADCPTGLLCSHNRTAAPPCESACGLPGDATDARCVPSDQIGSGQAFRCSNGRLELRICLARTYCNDCDSDADCRSIPGQVCARGGDGTKACSMLCDPGTNSCPWGSASSCQVWDDLLGVPTCGHRAGSCHGTGESCAPCVDDRDCPTGFCSFNSFSSEQFCVDEAAFCACGEDEDICSGGGCPETPGGLTMNCVSRQEGAPPDACYGALTDPTDQASPLGCWPPEPQ